jgi:hypothetical protein
MSTEGAAVCRIGSPLGNSVVWHTAIQNAQRIHRVLCDPEVPSEAGDSLLMAIQRGMPATGSTKRVPTKPRNRPPALQPSADHAADQGTSAAAASSEADEARRAQELSDLEEELESLRGQVKLNLDRISTLIQELPLRIISIERLQILSLTLQNHALNVQRRERDLQAATVRRVLLRTNESVVEPSALLVKALSKVEMLLPGKVSPAERVVREVIVQEVLEACSRLYGGGEELLKLAQGTGKQRWEASSADDAWEVMRFITASADGRTVAASFPLIEDRETRRALARIVRALARGP